MTQTPNPLQAWFRRAAIYMRLPSQGQYWPEGSLDMPTNGEFPVLPMTALDEITYRTPDALFNGQAVIDVVQSCIPNIRDAWAMPSTDLISVLISIRIASYGQDMEIISTCPKCNETQDYTLDLRQILDGLSQADFGKSLSINDLEVFFAPMNYRQQTQIGMDQYETQRLIANSQDATLTDDQKNQSLNEAMKRISQATTRAMAFGIAGIRAPSGFASEPEHIMEFLTQCDRRVYAAIRDHQVTLREASDIKPVDITCSSCENRYQQQIELDLANFFAAAS